MELSSPRIEAVLFDIGGVLLQLNYREAFREFGLGSGTDVHDAMTRLGNDSDYDAFERGKIDEDTYRQSLERKIGRRLAPDKFRAVWNGIVGDPFPGVVPLLRQLKPYARIFALSNSNETHINSVLERFSWLGEFDGVYSSHQLGCRKPELRIYQTALQRMAVAPSRVLFFDDRQDNVETAKLAGMHAHPVSRSPDDIRAGLQQHGVLPRH